MNTADSWIILSSTIILFSVLDRSASRPTRSTASGWSWTRWAGTRWAFAHDESTAKDVSSLSASVSPRTLWEMGWYGASFSPNEAPESCIATFLAPFLGELFGAAKKCPTLFFHSKIIQSILESLPDTLLASILSVQFVSNNCILLQVFEPMYVAQFKVGNTKLEKCFTETTIDRTVESWSPSADIN